MEALQSYPVEKLWLPTMNILLCINFQLHFKSFPVDNKLLINRTDGSTVTTVTWGSHPLLSLLAGNLRSWHPDLSSSYDSKWISSHGPCPSPARGRNGYTSQCISSSVPLAHFLSCVLLCRLSRGCWKIPMNLWVTSLTSTALRAWWKTPRWVCLC